MINDEDNFTVIVEAEKGQQLLTRINPLDLPDVVLVNSEIQIIDGTNTLLEPRKRYRVKMRMLALYIHNEV